MSRISVRSFLAKAKQSLAQSIRSKGEHPASFVIGNESADLDSITSALVYGYIQSSTPAARKANSFIIPVTNIPSKDLRLRPELKALLKHADLKPSDLVTLDDLEGLNQTLAPNTTSWTLVDHNVFQGELGQTYSERVTGVIDHHEDEGRVPGDAKPRIIEKTGSCSSHVVNYCSSDWDSISNSTQADTKPEDISKWNAHLARLALASILIDTVNFEAEKKTTEHDRNAVKYLESMISATADPGLDFNRNAFFQEIDDAKSDLDELSLEEILSKDYKQWSEGSFKLGISSAVKPIEYLKTKEDDFVGELLKFAKDRQLQIFALMTAHKGSGSFARQLLLVALQEGKPVEAVKKFVKENSKELQLEESETEIDTSTTPWIHLWEQKDLEPSRKQVAPMLREAMKG